MFCKMAVWLSGLVLALSAFLADTARADGPSAVYDAGALVGASQAQSLNKLAMARLTRIRSLRPEAAALPTIERGGPSGAQAGPSLFDVVARVGDLPLYSGGYHDFGVWSHGFGRERGIDNANGAVGFSSTLAGGALGVDWAIGENWVFGSMVAASAGRLQWHDNAGTGRATGGAGALYLGYSDRDMFLDASLSAGLIRSDASMDAAGLRFGGADATIGMRIDAGFDMGLAGLTVRPTVSASMLTVGGLDGGFDLAAADTQMRQLDARFGLSVGRTFTIADMPLETTGNLSWQRGFTVNDAVAAGSADPVPSARLSHDSVAPRLGLSLNVADNWVLFTRYDGNFSGGAPRHTVTSGMRASF